MARGVSPIIVIVCVALLLLQSVQAGSSGALLGLGPWAGGHHHPHAKNWVAEGRRSRLIHTTTSMWGIRGGGQEQDAGGAASKGDDDASVTATSGSVRPSKEDDSDVIFPSPHVLGDNRLTSEKASEHGNGQQTLESEPTTAPPIVEDTHAGKEQQEKQEQELSSNEPQEGEEEEEEEKETVEAVVNVMVTEDPPQAEAVEEEVVDPLAIPLTDQDREVLELLNTTETWDRTMVAISRIPAIKGCPEFHLKITKAVRQDAFLAATALGRLARQVATEGEAEQIIGDRRFGQLLECIWCHVSDLSAVDISNIMLGLACLRSPEDQLLLMATKTATEALQQGLWKGLPTSEIVNLAWSLAHSVALGGFPSSSSGALLEALEARLVSEWSNLSAHEVARLAWALTILDRPPSSRYHDTLLRLLGEKVLQSTAEFGIRDLTTAAGALSCQGYHNETVREGVASAAVGRLAELSIEDLGTLARALAIWGPSNDVLMLELLVCAEVKRADLRAGQVADILWAFGSTRFVNATAFMSRELPDLFKNLADFSPPDLIKVIWSYATLLPPGKIEDVGKLGQQQQHLLSALAGRAAASLLDAIFINKAISADEIEPVLLAQLAWALATLNHYEEDLFTSIAQGLEKRLNELDLEQVAALAWAFARVRHSRNSLYDQIALLVEMRHHDFNVKDLTLCLWSLASRGYRLRFQPPELNMKAEDLRELKPSDAGKLLWALAKSCNGASPELIETICTDVRTKLATFSPEDLTATAWALAHLETKGKGGHGGGKEHHDANVPPTTDREKLVIHIAKTVLGWVSTFTSAQLACLIQALITLEYSPVEGGLVEPFSEEVEKRLKALLDSPRGREDDLFHLSRCQQLLTFWKDIKPSVGIGGGTSKRVLGHRWKYDKMKKVIGEAMIHIV